MSQRERWIIYPLLFLTFCLAIRDQWPLAKTSTGYFSELECRRLTVLDDRGDPAVVVGTRFEPGQRGSGQIKILAHERSGVGSAKTVAVLLTVSDDQRGVVQTNGNAGMQLVELSGNNGGGYLAFHDEQTGKPVYLHVSSAKSPAATGGVTLAPPEKPPAGDSADPRSARPRPPTPPDEDDAKAA